MHFLKLFVLILPHNIRNIKYFVHFLKFNLPHHLQTWQASAGTATLSILSFGIPPEVHKSPFRFYQIRKAIYPIKIDGSPKSMYMMSLYLVTNTKPVPTRYLHEI